MYCIYLEIVPPIWIYDLILAGQNIKCVNFKIKLPAHINLICYVNAFVNLTLSIERGLLHYKNEIFRFKCIPMSHM